LIIAAGVWTGVGFSNLNNCRTRIQKFWNRSGVGVWKSDSGHLWSQCGPRVTLYVLMCPTEQFEFETPAVHTTQRSECMHFQWLRKILLKSERGRRYNISFITKILQICCRKNGIAVFYFTGTCFIEKRPKKSQKAKLIFWGQPTWDEAKKGQLKYIRPTNLKRGPIWQPWPPPRYPDRGHNPTVTNLLIEYRVIRPPYSIGILTSECKRCNCQCDATNSYRKLCWNL